MEGYSRRHAKEGARASGEGQAGISPFHKSEKVYDPPAALLWVRSRSGYTRQIAGETPLIHRKIPNQAAALT
jgi:hypothetical protein